MRLNGHFEWFLKKPLKFSFRRWPNLLVFWSQKVVYIKQEKMGSILQKIGFWSNFTTFVNFCTLKPTGPIFKNSAAFLILQIRISAHVDPKTNFSHFFLQIIQ